MFIEAQQVIETAQQIPATAPTWLQSVVVLSTIGVSIVTALGLNKRQQTKRSDKQRRDDAAASPTRRK